MPALELGVVAQRQRPRADEAHLAAEDVPDLRHLVEREAAQERADRRHARVLADLEERPIRFVRGLELRLETGGVRIHRPELEHPELALTESDPRVAIEHRAA